MAQVKIYGLKKSLNEIKYKLSETIHKTIVKELSFPKEKRYHRFIAFDEEDMLFPDTKSEHYIIIEIMIMQGRSEERRKNLIKALFRNIEKELGIAKTDIEVCIIESAPTNWGFSGQTGDEMQLNYKVNV